MKDWQLRKYNARQHLLSIYRQLRDVLLSDLHLTEKELLFEKTHRSDVQSYAWLVRPDLYTVEAHTFAPPSSRTRPIPESTRTEEEIRSARLRAYLNEMHDLLDYTTHFNELSSAVNAVAAVMDLDLPITVEGNQKRCSARKDEFQKHVPRLEAAFDALRLKPHMDVRAPMSGYFWDCYSHQEWIKALRACVARA